MDASTPQCDNCYSNLHGGFCHQCGQEKKSYIRNVSGVVTEFFGEFSNWDTRVWRTLVPLWFRPGYLSRRYVDGHRVPYVPPLRLYLFTSIIAFLLLAKLLPDTSMNVKNSNQPLPSLVSGEAVTPEQFQQELVDKLQADVQAEGMDMPFLSTEASSEFERKIAQLSANPKQAINKFFSLAPQMMLLLLPLFALLLKLLYIRSERYYMEHLIVALHSHSFILQFSVFYLALELLAQDISLSWLSHIIKWLANAVLLWMPLYLLLCQKNYYRQSWGKTLVKFWLVSSLYNLMAVTALVGLIILSILWA
uniref:Gll1812 protein n=1 Tax=Rheinheimera sp. BAL341 TaxID=1708203 RepID=A0A486XH47_9GAMM